MEMNSGSLDDGPFMIEWPIIIIWIKKSRFFPMLLVGGGRSNYFIWLSSQHFRDGYLKLNNGPIESGKEKTILLPKASQLFYESETSSPNENCFIFLRLQSVLSSLIEIHFPRKNFEEIKAGLRLVRLNSHRKNRLISHVWAILIPGYCVLSDDSLSVHIHVDLK